MQRLTSSVTGITHKVPIARHLYNPIFDVRLRVRITTTAMKCCVCESNVWLAVSNPVEKRSITTAGHLLNESLSKGHCKKCGLLQRIDTAFVGESDFYEEKYAGYYGRPGAEIYDAPRYTAMTDWMCAALGDFDPRSILDVGCGAGWSMVAARKRFPRSDIEGVEPSKFNAGRARQAGFEVYSTKIGADSGLPKTYDLIYANNVLQHVLSPIEFLIELRDYLSSKGRLVLICPDSSRPSSEMLWVDHNYSFSPGHLVRLAEKAGFHVRSWLPNPDHATLLNKQLIVFAKGDGRHAPVKSTVRNLSPDDLYEERSNYVKAWETIRRVLGEQVRTFSRTFNFGCSSWTWLLAGYCPEYWRKVDCCLVDQCNGACLDKPVQPPSQVLISPGDGLTLGVNPVTQESYARRFRSDGWQIVRWDNYVQA